MTPHPRAKDLKSANHHWWPRSLSREWADGTGKVGRIDLDGSVKRIPHAKVGGLRNAHMIKLAPNKGEESVWDENFEHQFDWVDSAIPRLVESLHEIPFEERFDRLVRERWLQVKFEDEGDALFGLIASLIVRSPKNREASVALAEKLRGPIPEPERSALIGGNMRQSFGLIHRAFKGRGKIGFLDAADSEFIFGDGFPNNLSCVVNSPHTAEVFVPILPRIAVLFFSPMQYTLNGRYFAATLTNAEVSQLNESVQIYAGKELFFRELQPMITDHFKGGKFLQFAEGVNIVRNIGHSIPGVPPRDTTFDRVF